MAAARTLLADNPIALADRAARDALSQWQQGISPRVALQAEVVWPGMADGYLRGGASDVARPFTVTWWRLGPVKTQHCGDCPWMAFNSPYGGPGSGNNELWQVPGDGRTACGAGCHCSLELGWQDMPGSGMYDWTDFFPPDMPRIHPPQPLPTSEAAAPGLLPGGVPRGPLGVAQGGEYVYPGTATEQAYRAQMDIPHVSPYGTIREGLSVAPPPGSIADLSARQQRVLDHYRAAWYGWDAVRGNLPAAPTLFGERAPGVLVAMTGRRWLVRDQFPSWDQLSDEQQAALQDVYDAVTGWNAASATSIPADAAVAQVEADVRDLVGSTLSEPRDWTRAVLLYSPDQPRGKGGKWTVWHGQLQHEAGNPRGHQWHVAVHRTEGGGGAGGGGHHEQIARQEAILSHMRDQHATITRWLSNHTNAHPRYEEAQYLHERLTYEIGVREAALRGQTTAPREVKMHPAGDEPRGTPAGRRIQSLAKSLNVAEGKLAGLGPNHPERAQRQQVVDRLRSELHTAQAAHAAERVASYRAYQRTYKRMLRAAQKSAQLPPTPGELREKEAAKREARRTYEREYKKAGRAAARAERGQAPYQPPPPKTPAERAARRNERNRGYMQKNRARKAEQQGNQPPTA